MCVKNNRLVMVRQACGFGWAVPVDCGDPLCVDCERQRAAERREKWLPVLKAMRYPRMMTLTEQSGHVLVDCIRSFQDAFRKLLDLRLGPRNLTDLSQEALSFVLTHYTQLFNDGKITEAEQLERLNTWQVSISKFERSIERYHSKAGKWPRMRDMIGAGFASLEITHSPEGWHVHRHCVTDGQFIPWPVLVAAWLHVTNGKGFIVDIRAIDKTAKSIKEVAKYLSKSWELSPELHSEFRTSVRGLKRIWPLGGAKPVVPVKPCPGCGDPNCKAHVVGQGEVFKRGKIGETDIIAWQSLFDHQVVYFIRDQGRWRSLPLDLIPKEFACHSQTVRGP